MQHRKISHAADLFDNFFSCDLGYYFKEYPSGIVVTICIYVGSFVTNVAETNKLGWKAKKGGLMCYTNVLQNVYQGNSDYRGITYADGSPEAFAWTTWGTSCSCVPVGGPLGLDSRS